jgi:peptidyl-tRNA hydrolase, PTH1 family
MKYLIAGLGNIGPQYALTRHNIGFMVADRLAGRLAAPAYNLARHALLTEGRTAGKQLTIIKPTTFMNASGKALRYYMQELKVPASQTLVIVDELALPFGTIRLKPKGSAGGHNGLKDVEAVLGNSEYPRLRCGIGAHFAKGQQVVYVLGNFTNDELNDLNTHLDRACDMIISFCTRGLDLTMTDFNQ